MPRNSWPRILRHAATIVESYDTGVTLRQLYYRLVADGTLTNKRTRYNQLSNRIAEARRDGTFPDLVDRTRTVHTPEAYRSPQRALQALARTYRRDRTEGQSVALYLGIEKHGMIELMQSWFGDLGIPVLTFGGYVSQSFVFEVAEHAQRDGREAVLLYAGDFDPSGEDIIRDFAERTGCWSRRIRVGLTQKQVEKYDLPPAVGKATDPRASQFVEKYGELIQVELDALPPDILRAQFQRGIDKFWDPEAHQASLDREAEDRAFLAKIRAR